MKYLLGFLGGVIVATTMSVFAQSGLPWVDNPAQWQMQQDMYRQQQGGMYGQQQSNLYDGGESRQRQLANPYRRNPC